MKTLQTRKDSAFKQSLSDYARSGAVFLFVLCALRLFFPPDINQPLTAIAAKTPQNISFHVPEWIKCSETTAMSRWASVYKASFTPTQPTITKAAVSRLGRSFNNFTNIEAANRMITSPIIPPAKMTINCPPSSPPIFGSDVQGA